MKSTIRVTLDTLLAGAVFLTGCRPHPGTEKTEAGDQSLVLALAVLGEDDDGSPITLPGEIGILTPDGDGWSHRTLEDPDANVIHKAMAYGTEGLLSLGGTKAVVKLLHPDGMRELLWEEDFGGQFNRMRDAEIGDIYGDGKEAIAVATHDQGVVAVIRRDDSGSFVVEELDSQPNTVVHEIELGDLDGDGVMEVYATPTAPNRVDGTAQPGSVVRYVPARNEARTEVANLGSRHAKEILVTDIDGDGRDELYVSVEAVSGGKVEIRRYLADTDPGRGELIASLDDKLCRFLTVGDVDGDGKNEMVAAASKSGLWLLRPREDRWDKELIDAGSSGFEHASILLDLDKDGRDELYVASDNQKEVRRYDWGADGWTHNVLLRYEDKLNRFTWNIMAVPTALLPSADVQITDVAPVEKPPAAVVDSKDATEPAEVVRGLRLNTGKATPGYVMYNPLLSDTTYLLNYEGEVVHLWKCGYTPSGGMYLKANGNLLRTARNPDLKGFKGGGQGGRIQEIAPDGTVVWDWEYANEQHLSHHDIEPMPNGNILVIAWESKSAKEASQAGRRPDLIPTAGIWPDHLIEIKPRGASGADIVWEWHAWDHLIQDFDSAKDNYGVPSEHPGLINVNGDNKPVKVDPEELARLKALGYVPPDASQDDLSSDIFHSNAVDYNAELDQIAISSHNFHEIWIIDHSTTTGEAAGHSGGRRGKGGDLLYRWGNPAVYGRGTGDERMLGGQHDIQWIGEGLPGEGNLIVFNNNVPGEGGPHSAIYEWKIPANPDGSYVVPANDAFGPAEPDWKYEDPGTFFAPFISGVQRLPNGNTFICQGPDGRIFEVTADGGIVWEYRDPFSGSVVMPDGSQPQPVGDLIHAVFRATKILPDHSGLRGLNLEPLDPQPPYATVPATDQ